MPLHTMEQVTIDRITRGRAPDAAVLTRALLSWAASLVLFGIVALLLHAPLVVIPLAAVGIGLIAAREWKRFRQYSPLIGGYLLTGAILGYGVLPHGDKLYPWMWCAWLAGISLSLEWVKRRVQKHASPAHAGR